MRLGHSLFTLLLSASTFAYSSLAFAQAVPNTARPELQQRQYQIEETRPEVGGVPLITVPEQGVKALKGEAKFELKSVEFEGLTKFTANDLKPIYESKIGKSITLSELSGIAAQITAFYRNHGYILTRAVLPPQRIEHGVVKIRIVEGYVSDVQVNGDVGKNDLIRRYVNKIKDSKPLNSKTLERYLLLINDLPGVQAKAVLQPSPTTPGASQVVINITRKPVDASLALDNRGTRYLGPEQATATVGANNLFGQEEQTQLRIANTIFYPNELKYGEFRHQEQVGSEGTTLIFTGNYVHTVPGYTLKGLNVIGDNAELSVGVNHPLIRSRQSNWFLSSDFTTQRVNSDASGGNFYEDNLRVLRVGTSYDFVDGWTGVNRLETNVSHGFNWDTSNDGLLHSRTSGKAAFYKIDGHVTRSQPITGPWTANLAIAGQYSAEPLYSAQEFALGGPEFGSAYDTAELSGDSGIAARAELQYNHASGNRFLPSYQLYGFYDVGEVWNRDIVAASELSRASLASTGIGTRFNLLDPLSGGLEVAVPLTRKVAAYGADGASPRVFFNLLYRY